MSVRLRRVQRVFVTFFFVGVLVCIWALFSTALQVRNLRGDIARVETKLLGVTLISASRSGPRVEIRPHLGIPLLLVALPAFAAFVRYVTLKRHDGN